MVKVTITKRFACDMDRIWECITNHKNADWRSDIEKSEVIDATHFVEYGKNHVPTYFTITAKEKGKRYQFELKNRHLQGSWCGLFRVCDNGEVELSFTEEIEIQNRLVKWLFAKRYLRSQQRRYMQDLEKTLYRSYHV